MGVPEGNFPVGRQMFSYIFLTFNKCYDPICVFYISHIIITLFKK